MKVFLSWSGDLSHKVAYELREWLPSVLQFVKPYISSEDIDKGARWSTDIAKELQASEYGVLVITRDNQDAPWISFEAGALSKQIDKSRVSPLLFDMKRSDLKEGPLLQFQSTIYTKEDIAKLIAGINANAPEVERLAEERLKNIFEVWWPQLQRQLDECLKKGIAPKAKEKTPATEDSAVLEELLELARQQQKLLRSPEEILPPGYLRMVLKEVSTEHGGRLRERDPGAWRYLIESIGNIRSMVLEMSSKSKPLLTEEHLKALETNLIELKEVARYLTKDMDLDDWFLKCLK